jgi:LuxR family transcriptional regulator of spore coat protein
VGHIFDNEPGSFLTRREQEILEYVADGWSAKQVAQRIDIAPRTVERHIENIRMKMNARNTPHMISCAFTAGMLKVGVGEMASIQLPTKRSSAAR